MNPAHSSISNKTVVVLALLIMMGAAASDAIIPIIPAIANDAGVSIGHAQLTITLFIGGYSFGQIPSGYFGDRFGRLPTLYAGTILFSLASFMCLLLDDFNQLLAARFLQGVGASAGAVLSRGIARDLRGGVELARLLAILGVALSTTTVVAPLLGAWVASYIHWSWLFAFYVAQGLITVVLCYLWLEETHPRFRAGNSTTDEQPLMLPLMECAKLYFASKQSVWATGMLAFGFFGMMSILSSFGTIVIQYFGVAMKYAGPLLSLGILFFVAGNVFSHRLVASMGSLKLVRISVILFCASALVFTVSWSLHSESLSVFWFASILYFFGIGLLFPNISTIALNPLPGVAGFASSILGTIQTFFAFLAALIGGMLYSGDFSNVTFGILASAIATLALYQRRPAITDYS